MAQKTKKSPTPPTAKKTGARLPKGSPKGSRSSVPPDAAKRLADLGREVLTFGALAEHSAVSGGAR